MDLLARRRPTQSAPGAIQTQTGVIREVERSAEIADAAVTAFVRDQSAPAAPICVVIPALNEEECVADVVRTVPETICGLAVETLVIDDGSRDNTEAEAKGAGALVCRFPVNLGMGVALRAGYRVARERGAQVICTADADGQFDPRELPNLVAPILAGEADMVNGSRRMGSSYSIDATRALGVVVFGTLMTVLTGTKITDPANGLRAFRAEATGRIDLRQTQYQTSEMLINMIGYGYTVKEVPSTMYARAAGMSKKGKNWRYGYRFAKVIVTTWWRLRPVAKVNVPAGRGLW